jgi:hypothetical protein
MQTAIRNHEGYALMQLDNHTFGKCTAAKGDTYECDIAEGNTKDYGYSKFRCQIDISATEIHNAS